MAEFVEHRMQEMVGEIEDMERLNLLSKEEITKLIEKRREFEYQMARQTKEKECFINHVLYESKLLDLLSIRRKKMMMFMRFNELDKAITLRVVSRLRMMTRMWTANQDIWNLRISFAKSRKYYNEVSTSYAEQSRYHGDDINLWVSWAQWEIKGRKDFQKARTLLLSRATLYHPNSLILTREYFRLELLYVEHLKSKAANSNIEGLEELIAENRQKILDCEVAKVIYRNAKTQFETPDLHVQFFSVAKKFPFAQKLAQQILRDLTKKYPNDVEVWLLKGKMTLEGIDCSKLKCINILKAEKEQSELKLSSPMEKLDKFLKVYDRALSRLGAEKFLDVYLRDLFKLLYDVWGADEFVNKIGQKILRLLRFNEERLTPTQSLIRVRVATMMKRPLGVLRLMSKKATLAHPDSPQVKLQHLRDFFPKLKFQDKLQLIENSSGVVGAEICLEVLNRSKGKLRQRLLDRAFTHHDRELCKTIRLKWIQECSDISECQNLYNKYSTVPPLDVRLHACMLEKGLNLGFDESINENQIIFSHAIDQFGASEVGLWLCYVEFLRKSGEAKKAAKASEDAMARLNSDLLPVFVDLNILLKKQTRKRKSFRYPWKENEILVEIGEKERTEHEFWKTSNIPSIFEEELSLMHSSAVARTSFFKSLADINRQTKAEKILKAKEDCTNVWAKVYSLLSGVSVSFQVKKIDVSDIGVMKEAEDFCEKSDKMFDEFVEKREGKLSEDLVPSGEMSSRQKPKEKNELALALEASEVLKPEFLRKTSLEPLFKNKRVVKKERKEARLRTAGDGWFGMKAPEKTDELTMDLNVLKMRSVLDPKRHYKRSDMKETPKFFQFGKVKDSAPEFYSSRVPKKQRKRQLAEEIMNDEKVLQYQKKKFGEIIQKKQAKINQIKTAKNIARTKLQRKRKNKNK